MSCSDFNNPCTPQVNQSARKAFREAYRAGSVDEAVYKRSVEINRAGFDVNSFKFGNLSGPATHYGDFIGALVIDEFKDQGIPVNYDADGDPIYPTPLYDFISKEIKKANNIPDEILRNCKPFGENFTVCIPESVREIDLSRYGIRKPDQKPCGTQQPTSCGSKPVQQQPPQAPNQPGSATPNPPTAKPAEPPATQCNTSQPAPAPSPPKLTRDDKIKNGLAGSATLCVDGKNVKVRQFTIPEGGKFYIQDAAGAAQMLLDGGGPDRDTVAMVQKLLPFNPGLSARQISGAETLPKGFVISIPKDIGLLK